MTEADPPGTSGSARHLPAAEHFCSVAEDEFATAQRLYTSAPHEYRRAMDFAWMHLRIADVMTQGASLVATIAIAETDLLGPVRR